MDLDSRRTQMRIQETLLDITDGPLTSFVVLSRAMDLASVMKPERAPDIANEVDRIFRSMGWFSERGLRTGCEGSTVNSTD